ncbi:MAG: hypothetical protein DSO09_00260 [Candidatus Methanomethylicota archaeon]|uniref:Uncharacterized protein n=1 Tax=Thermoproteota archaeon TaxID=2056631 RepID=A0A520KFP6_9CREN|nr:hypothetical protein [Candidatus Methanomethylicia archaeon]NHV46118.1 hypothetical protein [Candidatus Verstraetearchaeota archaeon]RZN55998.1 MAG: hypothetical protein EF809_03950 [Candidatus Verstraetearchaeota archaeon]TDA40540.1 MAG: hypothetical protein DSO09_00260 [Candidatus Verstraetearchaeota archaeon]
MNISIMINYLFGEKIMDINEPINIQITTNISITKLVKTEEGLEGNFIFTANYTPAIANIIIKGIIKIIGEKNEIENISKEFNKKKILPSNIIQIIANTSFIEGVIIAKSLNIPPPIPLPIISQSSEEKKDTSYIA